MQGRCAARTDPPGGKTLALAAAMENRGQIYATDTDGVRAVDVVE